MHNELCEYKAMKGNVLLYHCIDSGATTGHRCNFRGFPDLSLTPENILNSAKVERKTTLPLSDWDN